jgi:hypothetical protein
MFGTWFYHKRVRTAVSVFGSLFNNLHVLRHNGSGETISQVKVPLSYAPKRNFISRLEEMSKGENAERRVAMKLPRMSFEITNMAYDPTRQLPKVNNISKASNAITKRQKIYTATPYTISFQLNIYAKSQDDALQIVEQVLPYFAPQYTATIKPFADIPSLTEDVPISLTGTAFSDDFEGAVEQRRTIIYTLDFDMKIALYGPEGTGDIIREVRNNFFMMESGFNDSDVYLNTQVTTLDPSGVSVDSDYGFLTTTQDSDGNVVVDGGPPPLPNVPRTYALTINSADGSDYYFASGQSDRSGTITDLTDSTITINAGDTLVLNNLTGGHVLEYQDGSNNTIATESNTNISYTFTTAGTYYYVCTAHPSTMIGTIIVSSV